MKFTLSWLKKHLKTNASVEDIAGALTSLGLEVEEAVDNGKAYEPFLVAEIEEAQKHPNADKLKVCKVNNGKEKLQVVCGAPNARAGLKVVLAPVGALIPSNGMLIKASKIRDVESNGMLCSAEELGLSNDSEGIIELDSTAIVGQKFVEFAGLNEVVFNIGLTPNRGDAASVYGIARDLSAFGIGELITIQQVDPVNSSVESKIKVTIEDKQECYEFLGRTVTNLKNIELEGEIAKTLKFIGFSPKTLLVDISNYAMLNFGRPNHIYDADKIEGNITVRKARHDEKFIALGGDEITLEEDMLVIADDIKVLAIAGVIGGELSKVDENTKNIFIEVANFNPIDIARTGRKINIHTDARYRFERRVDAGNSEFFINYLTSLIIQSCGGESSQLVRAEGLQPDYITELKFSFATISKIAGFEIPESKVKEILDKLGFVVEGEKVKIPTYRRGDITQEVDIIEEVLRVYGFENIPSMDLNINIADLFTNKQDRKNTLSKTLRVRGLDEVISWSFMDKQIAKLLGFSQLVFLENPISQELSVMRPTILANLLNFTNKNLSRGLNNFAFYEEGHIFGKHYNDLQTACIAGLRVGETNTKSVYKEERLVDFYDIKADIFALCNEAQLNPNNLTLSRDVPTYYHTYRSAAFKLGNKVIAFAGEIHPNILKKFDIKSTVLGFEIFTDNLPNLSPKTAKTKLELSDFQSVSRDFAFIVDQELEAGNLLRSIRTVNKALIEEVSIFDVYIGKGVEEGKKSIALNVKVQPKDKTLSDKEIEEVCNSIINEVSVRFGAKLR